MQPPTIFAEDLLDTELTVKLRTDSCIPVVISGTADWREFDVRNYYSPITSEGALYGPTLRVRKALLEDPTQVFDEDNNPIVQDGTRVKILLKNMLPNDSLPFGCQAARYAVCSQNPTIQCTCDDPNGTCDQADGFTCDKISGDTCKMVTIAQETPNCFHGPEVTNLHYHGTHVSPQPHQDYVLLNLYSSLQTNPKPKASSPDDPSFAVGEYQTDINPLPWNQAPGTHWYHPHKHGSTALQLINGMAGALLIRGEIDDYLYGVYGVDPADRDQLERFEKVLIVQQIWDEPPFFQNPGPDGFPPTPLINGQLVPTIHMKYGEVQRWRLISATTNALSQSSVSFSSSTFPGFEVRQIAQDGVQFAPENYLRQPLGNQEDGYELSPGNRVDLLVRAPDAPAGGGSLTFYVMRRVTGHVPQTLKKHVVAQNAFLLRAMGLSSDKAEEFTGPLLKVEVSGEETPPMQLPAEWPDMPPYLADISDAETTRTLAFSMSTNKSGGSTQGSPASKFFIDGMQFSGTCAGQTLVLDTAETWTITNDSTPEHPFHIHINPFQILSRTWVDSNGDLNSTVFNAPYPWMDTVALKRGSPSQPSETKIQQQYEDYSGSYVFHCHFLGHEDRGMMTGIQSVCPENADDSQDPISFGEPSVGGGSDDCALATSENIAPLPDCPGIMEEDPGPSSSEALSPVSR